MDKTALRTELKERRQKLSIQQVAELSQQIINNLWQMIDWGQIFSVHSYLPIAKNNEIDTWSLLKAARQANPGIKIATSKRAGEKIKTFWLDDKLQSANALPEGFKYDLVVVPMLGFDNHGYRLGYGGGFYDRFLATQPQALTIGLCYEMGRLDKLPIEAHDVPLKTIVTEKTVYKL